MAVLKKISFGIYNPFYVGEDFENPCLYMGEPKENRGYPTIFRLLNGSPVMKKAEDLYGMGSYCSDPDISYHDGLYYLINRTTIRKARTGDVDIDYDTKVHLTIGSICDGGFNIQKQICLFKENDVSPCMRYYKGRYIYLSLRTTSYNTGRPCEALFLRESMLPEGPWSTKTFINIEKGNYHYYEEYGEKITGKYTVVPKGGDFEDIIEDDIIILEDGYRKAKRNIDYIENPDEPFSRNHIVYKKRGFVGFSDFSMVGNEFDESGFAPLAIAIHIMYFGNREELRVHHFVSESNESISDPARKFEEAMNSLISWEQFDVIPKTIGLNSLIECYNMGKFPGLGVIKKYSLMHHIEMMGEYLEAK